MRQWLLSKYALLDGRYEGSLAVIGRHVVQDGSFLGFLVVLGTEPDGSQKDALQYAYPLSNVVDSGFGTRG